jgi:hypothetical protein
MSNLAILFFRFWICNERQGGTCGFVNGLQRGSGAKNRAYAIGRHKTSQLLLPPGKMRLLAVRFLFATDFSVTICKDFLSRLAAA